MTGTRLTPDGFTVVIGGGGAMAIGISAGILMAVKDAGLDVTAAAATIGTSAGATVAADLQLGASLDEIAARVCTDRPNADPNDVDGPLETSPEWRSWPELGRRAIGSAWVLTRALSPVRVSVPEPPAVLQRHFPGAMLSLGETHDWATTFYPDDWPDRRVCAVASDLDTGRRVVLEKHPRDGTPRATLRRALQASCAVPGLYPPVRVDGARLVDGGLKSATNLDVAAELPHPAVLAISAITFDPADPPSGPGRLLRMWPNRVVLREASYLRSLGHEVLLLRPGRMALELAGTTLFSGRITSDIVEAAYEGASQRLSAPDMQRRLERFQAVAQRVPAEGCAPSAAHAKHLYSMPGDSPRGSSEAGHTRRRSDDRTKQNLDIHK